MIDRRTYLEHCWNPYMLSEREFLEITDYVALRKSNYQTCSEKLVRSLLTTCELFETTMKAMYGFANKRPSFPVYMEKLDGDTLFDRSCRISVERGQETIKLTPFAEMAKEQAPEWWSAHNKVKHDRVREFAQGNLENALIALAALYYVNLILAKRVGDHWYEKLPHDDMNTYDVPNDLSRLFSTDALKTRHHVAGYEVYFMTEEEADKLIDGLFK